MIRVFFDIETDGYLNQTTKVHCLEMLGIVNEQKQTISCGSNLPLCITKGLSSLALADEIVGHNIICFDIPAIKKCYPDWKPKGKIIDTLIISRMVYPEIEVFDMLYKYSDKEKFEAMKSKKLIGKHSLEAWGYRLGIYKGDFGKTTDWKEWSKEMQHYCKQDVVVTEALYNYLCKTKHISWEAYELEREFQEYIHEQQEHGCYFDIGKAIKLKHKLMEELEETKAKIKLTVPNWIEKTIFEPKKNNKVKGYVVGQKYERIKETEFNPNSRMQIEKFLKEKYNWQPSELTETGRAKINSDVLEELEDLKWEEAALFSKFLTVTKLLGYISEGDNAWLKLVSPTGKIHGQLITNGAITRRCTHFKPNLGQVPSIKKYLGRECRELFIAPKEYRFVGADMSGIELRCFGHYLSAYDGGNYAHDIVNGDIHTRNQKAAGLLTRDSAKTFIYALLYGGGDAKIGFITDPHGSLATRKSKGRALKDNFNAKVPAYSRLSADISRAIKTRGYLKGIDGHYLYPRSAHAGLNTLLQNCAAVLMKRATIIFRQKMIAKNYWLNSVFPVLHVHDELSVIAKPEIAEEVKNEIVKSMNEAGEYYKLKIKVDGEGKIGDNWYDVH